MSDTEQIQNTEPQCVSLSEQHDIQQQINSTQNLTPIQNTQQSVSGQNRGMLVPYFDIIGLLDRQHAQNERILEIIQKNVDLQLQIQAKELGQTTQIVADQKKQLTNQDAKMNAFATQLKHLESLVGGIQKQLKTQVVVAENSETNGNQRADFNDIKRPSETFVTHAELENYLKDAQKLMEVKVKKQWRNKVEDQALEIESLKAQVKSLEDQLKTLKEKIDDRVPKKADLQVHSQDQQDQQPDMQDAQDGSNYLVDEKPQEEAHVPAEPKADCQEDVNEDYEALASSNAPKQSQKAYVPKQKDLQREAIFQKAIQVLRQKKDHQTKPNPALESVCEQLKVIDNLNVEKERYKQIKQFVNDFDLESEDDVKDLNEVVLFWEGGSPIKTSKQLEMTLPLYYYAEQWFLWVQRPQEVSFKTRHWMTVFETMSGHYAVKFLGPDFVVLTAFTEAWGENCVWVVNNPITELKGVIENLPDEVTFGAVICTENQAILDAVLDLPLVRLALYQKRHSTPLAASLAHPEALQTCFMRACTITNIEECENLQSLTYSLIDRAYEKRLKALNVNGLSIKEHK